VKKQRKHYTPEEKVAILRRHLVEGMPISGLCDELGLQNGVLPLAEGVLRERSRGFPTERPTQPSARTGTNRVSGEEDPDEG